MRVSLVLTGGLGLVAAMGLCLAVSNGCAGDGPDELPPEELETEAAPTPVAAGPSVAAPSAALAAPTGVAPKSPAAPAAPAAPTASAAPTAPEAPTAPAATVRPPLRPLSESTFQPLTLKGTRGGKLEYDIDGTPAEVAGMLLDFEGANGVRPWATKYHLLSTTGDTTKAEWQFKGKMGVNPKVVVALVRTDGAGAIVRIRFKLERKAFGIAAFFGDWKIRPVPGVEGRSHMTARIYIDSGLPFVNASSKDIEDGLRKDAAKMRPWMQRRLGLEGSAR